MRVGDHQTRFVLVHGRAESAATRVGLRLQFSMCAFYFVRAVASGSSKLELFCLCPSPFAFPIIALASLAAGGNDREKEISSPLIAADQE